MKPRLLLLALIAFGIQPPLSAHDDHSHQAKKSTHEHKETKAGPNGGRLLHQPEAEVFIRDDRRLQVTFLDAKHQPVEQPDAKVSGTGGDRSNPTRFSFKREGIHFISEQPLPDGNQVPLILQFKAKAGAKTHTKRFTANLAQCPTCDYKEYACVCAHSGDAGHSH